MKKLLIALLALVMVAGCSSKPTPSTPDNGGEDGAITSADYTYVFATDMQSMDYVVTQNAGDHEINANLVDGLLENDNKGNYVPALAEDWSANEDSTVWTFNIRPGVQWVTSTGEVYDELKAQDFVTGLRHAAEFNSQTIGLVQTSIKNLDAYINGQVAWEEVGVKALDDYTLEYTLEAPESYFDTKTTYSILFPINQEFLEAQGEGCKLGAADVNTCSFGNAASYDSILYNGGYILTSNVSKSEQKLVKNENYWDAEHVYIQNVTRVYDDGSDPASTVNGFENSGYSEAALLVTSDNFDATLDKYKDYAYNGLQNTYTFGMNFNFNRTNYNHTSKTTDKEKQDAYNALQNTDFRLAMKFGMDRVSYMAQAMRKDIAAMALRNMECPYNFVLTSEGKPYGDLVAANTTTTDNLTEGADPFYNPEKAMEYMKKAEAELDVTFPIKLDMLVQQNEKTLVAQASSLKQSIEASLPGYVEINVILADEDTVSRSSYTAVGPEDTDWDISTSTGWGADYMDPKTYLNIWSIKSGDVIETTMGIAKADNPSYDDAANQAAIKAVGLDKYQEMLDAADAIVNDNDARYEAYAKAEAFLIDNALAFPIQTQTRAVNYHLAKFNPFERSYSMAGISVYKFKNLVVGEEAITLADYTAAREAWMK
ncbi:peptide ABC transporter substrate-binding protein [Anaerorhabdus sp.]|jgi:oligopeptide transport system substrate-binding protein|uniref:peptide ABC transporter substrate-binding protein n=2 Tax=Anaerorhabdus sp. TaxID=1872524 RepID=UPI002FC6D470